MTASEHSRFSFAGLAAVLAGVAGVVLVTLAVVRFVGLLGDSTEQAAASSVAVASTSGSTVSTSGTVASESLVTVTDDSGSVSVAIPADWNDVSGSGWVVDGRELGPGVMAASDIDGWYSTWGTPGAFVGVSTTDFSPELGDFSGICTVGKTDERSAGVLAGTVQSWSRCGDEGGDFYVFVGGPADASYAVLVQLVSVDGTGLEVLQELIATFSYLP